MKKILLSTLVALSLASTAQAAEYTIDKVHSNVSFKIKHFGITNVSGNFRDFSADIDYTNGVINKLDATVKTGSVDTDNQKRDEHLKSADFFDAAKFSDMTFKLEKFKKDGDDAEIYGTLTIKNVSKPVKLEYEFGGTTKGKDGKERLGFGLSGKIKRSDFDFAQGFGSATLGDEVKIQIDVQAVEK